MTLTPQDIQPTQQPTRFSQLQHGQVVYAMSIDLSYIYKARINKVEEIRENYVRVSFMTSMSRENANFIPMVINDKSLNKQNICNNKYIATDFGILMKIAIEKIHTNRRIFNMTIASIMQSPISVGTLDCGTIYRVLSLDVKHLTTFARSLSKHAIGDNPRKLDKRNLRGLYGLIEKNGTLQSTDGYQIAPLMKLDHADENFFKEAKRAFGEITKQRMKNVNDFIKKEGLKTHLQLELNFDSKY